MDTPSPPATRTPPVSADCRGAVLLDAPGMHRRCRGNGAYRIPPFRSPVLPAIRCGCDCHAAAAR